jgi:hypothetical protein
MIRREIKRIRLDFGVHEFNSRVDIDAQAIEPMPVVPHMEVLLVLGQHVFAQLQLGQQHLVGRQLEQLADQPLTERPDAV